MTTEVKKFLRRIFPGSLTNKWPTRSSDLTSINFHLWGRGMSRVYSNNLSSLVQLKDTIRRHKILCNMIQDSVNNVGTPLQTVTCGDGEHTEQVILKK